MVVVLIRVGCEAILSPLSATFCWRVCLICRVAVPVDLVLVAYAARLALLGERCIYALRATSGLVIELAVREAIPTLERSIAFRIVVFTDDPIEDLEQRVKWNHLILLPIIDGLRDRLQNALGEISFRSLSSFVLLALLPKLLGKFRIEHVDVGELGVLLGVEGVGHEIVFIIDEIISGVGIFAKAPLFAFHLSIGHHYEAREKG